MQQVADIYHTLQRICDGNNRIAGITLLINDNDNKHLMRAISIVTDKSSFLQGRNVNLF